MIPYSRRLMAPQWMLWHVFRYRDGRQQSGNQRGSARDAASNHELSLITTSNITEAAATPTTTTATATPTPTIRSVSSVPGMLSARANSEHVAQLRIIHSISHPPLWKEAILRSRAGEVPHLIVQRSIDCPTWLLQVAAIYQSVHSKQQNIRSFRVRSTIAIPHPYHVDTYSIASIDQKLLYFSPYPASEHPPSLPLSQHRGAGRRRSGTQTQEREKKSPDKLPRANGVGRGSRRIGTLKHYRCSNSMACLCLGRFFLSSPE